ncbi:MAG: SufE family protein [Deltaproteobacteria bacterium]|nr:MAG: SufE family protein [Deltaproteobacteria bacterium]
MSAETIDSRTTAIVSEFRELSDWKARYRRIIEAGKALPELAEERREDRYRVKGCQSQVWLIPAFEGGRVRFEAWSDAAIVRGLIALLLRVYDDQPPEAILTTPPTFVDELGLSEHLSQSRANGLASMIRQVQLYATVYRAMDQREGA